MIYTRRHPWASLLALLECFAHCRKSNCIIHRRFTTNFVKCSADVFSERRKKVYLINKMLSVVIYAWYEGSHTKVAGCFDHSINGACRFQSCHFQLQSISVRNSRNHTCWMQLYLKYINDICTYEHFTSWLSNDPSKPYVRICVFSNLFTYFHYIVPQSLVREK